MKLVSSETTECVAEIRHMTAVVDEDLLADNAIIDIVN
jgi:hypothetical protein